MDDFEHTLDAIFEAALAFAPDRPWLSFLAGGDAPEEIWTLAQTNERVEALAAAMILKKARGEEDPGDDERMRRTLQFLLRQQLDPVNCFACGARRSMVGGMSENVGSPFVRIDYVQHSWAAMGHGGRQIGLVED